MSIAAAPKVIPIIASTLSVSRASPSVIKPIMSATNPRKKGTMGMNHEVKKPKKPKKHAKIPPILVAGFCTDAIEPKGLSTKCFKLCLSFLNT